MLLLFSQGTGFLGLVSLWVKLCDIVLNLLPMLEECFTMHYLGCAALLLARVIGGAVRPVGKGTHCQLVWSSNSRQPERP